MLKLTTDKHEASRSLSATAELIVAFWRQTDKQMDSSDALSHSRYREWRLNNIVTVWHLIS